VFDGNFDVVQTKKRIVLGKRKCLTKKRWEEEKKKKIEKGPLF